MGQGYSTRLDGAAAAARRLREQRHQLNRLRTQAPLGNSSISDGRAIIVKDSNGNVVVTLGHDSTGARGVSLTSPAGVDMLDFFIRASDDVPIIELNDAFGDMIIRNDPNGDQSGIGWPWIPVPFCSNIVSQWPSWNTGTFTTIAAAGTNKASQRLTALSNVVCDGGATAGQLRLLCNGTQVGATQAASTSVGAVQFTGTPADVYGASCLIELQARVTAGAGNCRGAIYSAMWSQV